jgi:hypothetical protein
VALSEGRGDWRQRRHSLELPYTGWKITDLKIEIS